MRVQCAASSARTRIRQIVGDDRQKACSIGHQRIENTTTHVRAGAHKHESARSCVVAHMRFSASCSQNTVQVGRSAQFQRESRMQNFSLF